MVRGPSDPTVTVGSPWTRRSCARRRPFRIGAIRLLPKGSRAVGQVRRRMQSSAERGHYACDRRYGRDRRGCSTPLCGSQRAAIASPHERPHHHRASRCRPWAEAAVTRQRSSTAIMHTHGCRARAAAASRSAVSLWVRPPGSVCTPRTNLAVRSVGVGASYRFRREQKLAVGLAGVMDLVQGGCEHGRRAHFCFDSPRRLPPCRRSRPSKRDEDYRSPWLSGTLGVVGVTSARFPQNR